MPLDFYYFIPSPFCRSVLLTARALGINLNMKELNVWQGEQNTPEFIAINPQHTIPTLVDGDVSLWESRAICTYLATKYGKDDSLYPKDPDVRARVDSLLYFDMGTLWSRFRDIFAENPPKEKIDKFHEAIGWLDGYLGRGPYAAGTDQITVADHVLVATVSSFEAAGRLPKGHPRLSAWLARCKAEMPGYEEANDAGAKKLGDFIKTKFGGASN